jgi:hypothetical protein
MGRPVVRLARLTAAAAAVALAIAAPAAAHGGGGVVVVASGLDNPRGLELAGGKLWIAEAGEGGQGPCVPGPEGTPVCFGLSGALTKVDLWSGWQKRVISGLQSLANPDGSSATGPSDISAGRKGTWVTIGLGGPADTRDQLPAAGQGMGKLYRLGWHGLHEVADLHAFEIANNPDGMPENIESNPNSVDAKGKQVLVADAGANAILGVKHRSISVFSLLPFGTAEPPPPMPGEPAPPPGTMIPVDPVPTSVVRGPDGSVYVGQLTGFPFVPGAASVFRIPPGGGTPEVVASGLTLITDLALGKDGSIYVTEFSTQSLLAGPAPGALIRIKPDGTKVELAKGRLTAPTGIVLGHRAAYVSNMGAAPNAGEVLRIPLGH